MSQSPTITARAAALDLLMKWGGSRDLADEIVERQRARTALSPADRGLALELFYGCLRQNLLLDWLIERAVSRRPRAVIVWILKLGFYQLRFLDRVPAHAAVNESVALARQHGSESEAKFVNAILRGHDRNSVTIATEYQSLRAARPWVSYSHPQWLWDRWVNRWGAAATAALCEWNNQPPEVFVRVNTLRNPATSAVVKKSAVVRGSPDPAPRADRRSPEPPLSGRPSVDGLCGVRSRVCETQSSANPRTTEGQLHPLIFRVDNATALFASDEWKGGQLYIQDPSTLRAVDVLDPQPGESVLDMCAAPGGKTTYIAQKMENRGRIIAADSSSSRLGLVAENCQRLGVQIVATLPCAGTRLDRCLRGDRFDRVLVDAPCSNTGVLRRRADLRWRLEEREIERLAALQARLLQAAAAFVSPGGVLVYSTCSLEAEENEQVAAAFATARKDFHLETQETIRPIPAGMDGAFVVRFRKV